MIQTLYIVIPHYNEHAVLPITAPLFKKEIDMLNHTISDWASTVCIIYFDSGVRMMSPGIIGEYVGMIRTEVKRLPRCIISARTANNKELYDDVKK